MLKTKITKVDLKDLQKMSFDVGTETKFYIIIGKIEECDTRGKTLTCTCIDCGGGFKTE